MDYKKIGLALLTAFWLCTNAYATTLVQNTISNDSVAGTFNTNFTNLTTWGNGNLEGSTDGISVLNIRADSIYEINMADDANPRVRDAELLSITTDSVATQNSFVYSGGVPATSGTLTSNISACVAYVNGYRVSKAATANTYTASRDTWVDLGQNGSYTFTAVANGAAEPVVAANSARLAKVVTDGTTISSVTDEANRRLPGLLVPANFRSGMVLSRDSTTTIIVGSGTVEVNNTMVSTTANTTLTLTTAGNWAGGTSLRAVSTHGYVGIDSSGNLRLHTTAPTHFNYGVSNTAFPRRYATWSSTVYRIIGWFYMNATGSGELDTWGVGNFGSDGITNSVRRDSVAADTVNDTAFASDLTEVTINFYSSGRPLRLFNQCTSTAANWLNNGFTTTFSVDNVGSIQYERSCNGTDTVQSSHENHNVVYSDQGTHTIIVKARVAGSDDMVNRKSTIVEEL